MKISIQLKKNLYLKAISLMLVFGLIPGGMVLPGFAEAINLNMDVLAPRINIASDEIKTALAGNNTEMTRREFLNLALTTGAGLLIAKPVGADLYRVPNGAVFIQAAGYLRNYFAEVLTGEFPFYTPDEFDNDIKKRKAFWALRRRKPIPFGLQYEVLKIYRIVYDETLRRNKPHKELRKKFTLASLVNKLDRILLEMEQREKDNAEIDSIDDLLTSKEYYNLSAGIHDGEVKSMNSPEIAIFLTAAEKVDPQIAKAFKFAIKAIFAYQDKFFKIYLSKQGNTPVDNTLRDYVTDAQRGWVHFVANNSAELWRQVARGYGRQYRLNANSRSDTQLLYDRHMAILKEVNNDKDLPKNVLDAFQGLNNLLSGKRYYINLEHRLVSPFSHLMYAYRVTRKIDYSIKGNTGYSTLRITRTDTLPITLLRIGVATEMKETLVYEDSLMGQAEKIFRALRDYRQQRILLHDSTAKGAGEINKAAVLCIKNNNPGIETKSLTDIAEIIFTQTDKHERQHKLDTENKVKDKYSEKQWRILSEASALSAETAATILPLLNVFYSQLFKGLLIDERGNEYVEKETSAHIFRGMIFEYLSEKTGVLAEDMVQPLDEEANKKLSKQGRKLIERYSDNLAELTPDEIENMGDINIRTLSGEKTALKLIDWLNSLRNEGIRRLLTKYHVSITGQLPLEGVKVIRTQDFPLPETVSPQAFLTSGEVALSTMAVMGKLLKDNPVVSRRGFITLGFSGGKKNSAGRNTSHVYSRIIEESI